MGCLGRYDRYVPSSYHFIFLHNSLQLSGRKWAFNGTVFITSIFGICMAIPSSYNGLLVLVAFTGFGIGGNIPIDTTIALEFLPKVTPMRLHPRGASFNTQHRKTVSCWHSCPFSNRLEL